MFAFKDYLSLVSFVPMKNKAVCLISSKHHEEKINELNKKPLIIMDLNARKGILFLNIVKRIMNLNLIINIY
jgi:hypothetical protein